VNISAFGLSVRQEGSSSVSRRAINEHATGRLPMSCEYVNQIRLN
jgi:hypothetical protein